ncbi:MAG TPA: hypothetical protein VGD77_07720 [Gemmatimonadaceae bacterium]
MTRWERPVLAILLVIAALAMPAPAAGQVVVVVPAASGASDVSLEELRRYFTGKGTLDNRKVQVVELVRLRRAFYQALLKMSEDDVRRRWVALMFRGEASAMPKEFDDAGDVVKYVAGHPGAIGFVEAGAAGAGVKVLSVGGKKPSDPGYPLR